MTAKNIMKKKKTKRTMLKFAPTLKPIYLNK